MKTTLQLMNATPDDFPRLLEIWEASVRTTHTFLKEEDILFYKNVICAHEVFRHVRISCARDLNDEIIGFVGVSNDNIEMLFLDPAFRGRGIGKRLLLHAVHDLGMTKVDVNEQNTHARLFYERFGFAVKSRSEVDGTGKPYPILHMKLTSPGSNPSSIVSRNDT